MAKEVTGYLVPQTKYELFVVDYIYNALVIALLEQRILLLNIYIIMFKEVHWLNLQSSLFIGILKLWF